MEKGMKIVCCKYGHHYDMFTYKKCPHCEEMGIIDNSDDNNKNINVDVVSDNKSMTEEKNKKSWFGKLGKKDNEKKQETVKNEDEEIKDSQQDYDKTMYLNDKTDESVNDYDSESSFNGFKPVVPDANVMKKPELRKNNKTETNGGHMGKADDIGKTVMVIYGQNDTSDSENETVVEPVTGWLVCIRGKYIGRSFTVKAGKSTLGRNDDNDICIDDATVSHEQALIMFEPRAQKFYLKAMEKAAFMYVNSEMLTERVQLNPYDCIEIGEKLAFIFIPLCGEKFNWKDYINNQD